MSTLLAPRKMFELERFQAYAYHFSLASEFIYIISPISTVFFHSLSFSPHTDKGESTFKDDYNDIVATPIMMKMMKTCFFSALAWCRAMLTLARSNSGDKRLVCISDTFILTFFFTFPFIYGISVTYDHAATFLDLLSVQMHSALK